MLTSESGSKPYDGTALTKPDVTVTGDGFVDGEVTDVKATGSALYVSDGEVTNTIVYTAGDNFKDSNYSITKNEGKLSITASTEKVVVTITGNKENELYDGTEKVAEGYTTSIDNALYTEADFKFFGNAKVNGTDADTYKMGLAANQFENANSNFANVEFSVTDGELVINPRTVVLTSESGSKPYDGTALTKPDVTVTGDGFVDGEVTDVKATGSALYVSDGEVTNTIVYTAGDNFKDSNYSITKNEGKLSITASTEKVVVTITGNKENELYDGTEKVAEGYTTSIDNALYTEADFKFFGNAKVNGTDADTYKMGLAANQFENANSNFANVEFSVTDGELVINPRTVVLTSESGSKPYDGTALTKSGVLVTGDGFVKEESATYTVTGSQTLVGRSFNTFSYSLKDGTKKDNYIVTKNEGILEVTDDSVDPNGVVTKTHENRQYGIGETVTFNIVVKNIYAESKNIIISEIAGVTITGESRFENVAPGETVETTAAYTITEKDILEGKFVNTVTATFEDGKSFENTDIVEVDQSASLTIEKVTTNKESAENGMYALGQVIKYTITVTNSGNLTIKDISVADPLTENAWTIESLAPGASKELTASYQVKEADILAGKVVNVATATGFKPDGSNVPEVSDSTTDQTAAVNGSLSVVKEAKSGEHAYKAGDTVEYTITVTNNGNVTISDITVTDEQTGLEETIATLAPNGVKTFVTSHVITEKDILAGHFTNIAEAKGKDPNGNDVDAEGEETVTTVEKNGHLTVTKTSDVEENQKAALGQTINYTITVINDGNLTITDIRVTDDLTGDEWTIDSLAPGESKEFTAEYVVTEADILAGKVVNVATAKGTSPDPENPDVPVTPGEKEDPTEPKNGHLAIAKTTTSTPENGSAYALGETIAYKITATNDGNLTLTNVIVEDTLTGNVEEKAWTIDSLTPGESKEFTAEYVVTEADILAGKVVNVATAKGTSPDPENPDVPVVPGEKEDPTETKAPSLFVEKTAEQKDGGYLLGDVITYTIRVVNNGNVTLSDVSVVDEKTGLKEIIGTMKVGETKEVTTTYTVTEADITAGKIDNVAVATGKDPEGAEVAGRSEKTVFTENIRTGINIVKTTTSTPANGERYVLGEMITYKITATNTGNQTLTRITVTDELTGNIGDKAWKIDTLAPGESKDFEVQYEVKEEDRLSGIVTNIATATVEKTNPEDPDVPVTPGQKEDLIDPEIPDGFYYVHKIKITKNVVDADGNAKNSNATFYAGIFTDADFTTLATNVSQNIVPLEMAGGSETSAEVELSILKTESATIYITEVDAEGNPVDYDENFAYDVSIDNEEITLDAENQNATVTIVNAEIEPEQVTPTPTQDENDATPTPAPEDKGTQKKGVKTGDDTPIGQFGFLLMCSVACVTLIIGKRKKEKRS